MTLSTSYAEPLAESLRPKHWSEVIGQTHLLGQGKPLRLAFEAGQLHSMVLWGPPGVGKTTLARLMAHAFGYEWIALSAVFSGVKDIRAAMDLAAQHQINQKKTILFIDEIHRFNKAQQDSLLPYTESGLIVLIGATTENPSFELNRALLSRTQVYVLTSLGQAELQQLLQRAHQVILQDVALTAEAEALLITYADGDGRRLLNLLEQIGVAVSLEKVTTITENLVKNTLSMHAKRFDKGGDHFYDQISALHKSVRGSHPDAALYWLTRMLESGADPAYLARRIVRMAWEDIGLADPRAMQIANDAATTYERLGAPEGELALAQAVIYLAIAAKSNAGYMAFKQVQAFVKHDQSRDVPIHLRNAPTSLMRELGHGRAYRYAHSEPHAYAAGESYFPEGMIAPGWYQPVDRGLERKIAEKLAFLRQLDQDALEK